MAAFQTRYTDSTIQEYDSNYKVNPPFRSSRDNKALIKGLNEGLIEVLTSGHNPQDEESKNLEFEYAEFGIIGLQTMASEISRLSEEVDMDILIACVSENPRRITQQEMPVIDEGHVANLTLFDPKRKWVFDKKNNYSKSSNSPLLNKELTGKAVGIINNGFYGGEIFR